MQFWDRLPGPSCPGCLIEVMICIFSTTPDLASPGLRAGLIEASTGRRESRFCTRLPGPSRRAHSSTTDDDEIGEDYLGLPGPSRPGLIQASAMALRSAARDCLPGPSRPGLIEAFRPITLGCPLESLPGPSRPGLIEARKTQPQTGFMRTKPPRAFAPGPH